MGEAGVVAEDVLVEEAEGLGQHLEARAGAVALGADMGAGAVVPGAEEQALVGCGQRVEAADGARGVAGAVHPAADAVVRQGGRHAGEVGLGGHGGGGEGRVVAEGGAAEAELGDEVGDVEVGGVLVEGCGQEGAVGVFVHGGGAGEAGAAEIGVVAEGVAVVAVERLDHAAVAAEHAGVEEPAGVEHVAPGVPDGADGHHGADGGVREGGGEVGGGADIGDAGDAHGTGGPGLPRDPVDDVVVVEPFLGGAHAGAGAEGRAGAAGVDGDDGVATGGKEIPVLGDAGGCLGIGTGCEGEAAAIGGEEQDRGDGAGGAGRQVDVDGKARSVAGGNVARGACGPPRQRRATAVEVFGGGEAPGRGAAGAVGHAPTAAAKQRNQASPMISAMSAREYWRSSRACVMFGIWRTVSIPAG